jgi:hypothetical protein
MKSQMSRKLGSHLAKISENFYTLTVFSASVLKYKQFFFEITKKWTFRVNPRREMREVWLPGDNWVTGGFITDSRYWELLGPPRDLMAIYRKWEVVTRKQERLTSVIVRGVQMLRLQGEQVGGRGEEDFPNAALCDTYLPQGPRDRYGLICK